MNNINTELEKVVHENLSEVQLGVFRREMDRLQKIEAEFVQQREDFKALQKEHRELTKEHSDKLDEIDSIISREKELRLREKEMTEQKTQLHIDNTLIQLRKENADQRVTDHQEMVKLIFRGPVFQKTVVEDRRYDQAVPVQGGDGSSGYVQKEYLSDNKTTTTTEEQE
jgi:hypothetical protein